MSATQIDPQHEHWDTECKLCGEWFTKRGMKTHIKVCPYCMFTSPYLRPRNAVAIHVRRSHKDKYLSRDDKIKAFIAKEIKLAGVKATKITALKDTNVPKNNSTIAGWEKRIRYIFDGILNTQQMNILIGLIQGVLNDQRIALIEQIEREVIGNPEGMTLLDVGLPKKKRSEKIKHVVKNVASIMIRDELRVQQRLKLNALRKEV